MSQMHYDAKEPLALGCTCHRPLVLTSVLHRPLEAGGGTRSAREVDMAAERRHALQTLPLFTGLPAAVTAELKAASRRLFYAQGEVIFRQGEVGTVLHLIELGQVKLLVPVDSGVGLMVGIVGPGECLGVVDLLEGDDRPYTASALTDVETLAVPQSLYLEAVQAYPDALKWLLTTITWRLRRTNELAADMAHLDIA